MGDDEGAHAFKGKDTIVADLPGKFMMPGIVATHEHPLMTMGVLSGLMLEYTEDADQMLASLKEYVETNPDGPAFSFGGSFEGRIEIYRQDIDKVVPDKPFLMIAASGHGGWCNTKALEVAGVTKDTPDPVDSFQREKDGTPNGYLASSASVMWMTGQLGVIQKDAVLGQAESILKQFASYGITAVYDAGSPYMEDVVFPVAAGLERSGDLTMRISASPITQRPIMTEGAMAAMKKYKALHSSEMFKVDTFKIHGGSPDGYTTGLLEPYADRPETTGTTSFPADYQREMTLAAAKMGYDIHTHAMGDRSVRQTLDAYQAVREAGYSEVRLATGHTSLVHPDDKPRFKELDVIVNTLAAKNAVPDETIMSRLGKDRYHGYGYQPMGSLLDLGVRVVMSADFPTAPLNPMLQMSIAMTRSNPGEQESLPPESERLTLEQAIRAYTIDAAYMLRWEDIIGSLEVGKRADLIVLDRNPFEITADEIAETNVLATMMNGVVVHEEAVDWSPPEELDGVDLVP